MVTVWLALSPAVPASGFVDYMRGSHKNPTLPQEDTFDENNLLSRSHEAQLETRSEDKVAIELATGQLSLHPGPTIHGSGPNVSDDRRIAAVIRQVTPEIVQESGAADFALTARGIDRTGHVSHVAPPRRNFEPRSLALHAEIRALKATRSRAPGIRAASTRDSARRVQKLRPASGPRRGSAKARPGNRGRPWTGRPGLPMKSA